MLTGILLFISVSLFCLADRHYLFPLSTGFLALPAPMVISGSQLSNIILVEKMKMQEVRLKGILSK